MTLPPRWAFETKAGRRERVPIQRAPDRFFDDSVPVADNEFADFAERFRRICDLLDHGRPRSAPIRIAALKRVLGYDNTSLREGARQLQCSPSTLHAAVKAILKGMKSNTF